MGLRSLSSHVPCHLVGQGRRGCASGEYFAEDVTHCWVVGSHRAHSAHLSEESKLRQNMVHFSKTKLTPIFSFNNSS